MNIMKLLKTVNKLKAGVAAIINSDENLLYKTKELYFSNLCIYSDSEDEE